jgi:hypothetical protein
MTRPEAMEHQLTSIPCISLAALRELKRFIGNYCPSGTTLVAKKLSEDINANKTIARALTDGIKPNSSDSSQII